MLIIYNDCNDLALTNNMICFSKISLRITTIKPYADYYNKSIRWSKVGVRLLFVHTIFSEVKEFKYFYGKTHPELKNKLNYEADSRMFFT